MDAIVSIGPASFPARIETARSGASCRALMQLLPYRGRVVHARWSGEALWSPLQATWPAETWLPPENAVGEPRPGQLLLYAGQDSEPEILIPYGETRFASRFGPLLGNPVLTIADHLDELARVGRSVLERGAGTLRIDLAHHP